MAVPRVSLVQWTPTPKDVQHLALIVMQMLPRSREAPRGYVNSTRIVLLLSFSQAEGSRKIRSFYHGNYEIYAQKDLLGLPSSASEKDELPGRDCMLQDCTVQLRTRSIT